MRRAPSVIAITALVTAVLAGTALAKGLTGNGRVEGKGLNKAITFRYDDDHSDRGFFDFLGQTGVMGSADGSLQSDWKDQPPTGELGPRYTITWELEPLGGRKINLVQYLYPYAEDGPLVYTPKSARIMQTAIPTGWWEAPNVLRANLESRGLPESNPDASVAVGAAEAATESSSILPYVLLVIVITSLVAIGLIAAKIRLRPAKAS